MVVLALASLFTETLWVDQTAYNASLLGAELDGSLSMLEKSHRIGKLAECLSTVHQNEGHRVFLDFDPTPDIIVTPFNPANVTPSAPDTRLNQVTVGGTVRNLLNVPINLSQNIAAASLVGSIERSQSPYFAGSGSAGNYGKVDCCGRPGNGVTGSCVSGGTYNNPAGCTINDDGFYPTP